VQNYYFTYCWPLSIKEKLIKCVSEQIVEVNNLTKEEISGLRVLRHQCILCLGTSFAYAFMHIRTLRVNEINTYLLTYSLTPWHYSPDGHKPPLIRFHSLI
jgi:hypothetical protein